MAEKKFKLSAEEIKELISSKIGCIASDKITVDGLPVGYMYREEPDNDTDSGWRFFSGTETQEYTDDASNFSFYKVNTIANYDSSIIKYLDAEIGATYERVGGTKDFILIEEE